GHAGRIMNDQDAAAIGEHGHIFLGAGHAANERRTWAAISLAGFMMVAEIAGGTLFGSLAVVADGFHMATHALALLIAAVAYSYARTHANDPRFVFGTGKLGDLAGFSSALVLAIIALMIGYEAAVRGDRAASIETERPGGARQNFRFADRGAFLESVEEIPEPHAFKACLRLAGREIRCVFE